MNKIKRMLALVLIVLCAVMAAPSYAPLTAQVSAATTKKVQINKKSATLKPGQTIRLKLKNTSKKPNWKSSNRKIAAVSKTGKVTAKKKGTATITAKLSKKSYKCKITVKVKEEKPAETPNTETPGTETPSTETPSSEPPSTETPSTETPSTETPPNVKDGVWITATGEKYHSIPKCGNTNQKESRLVSLEEALKLGLTPCSKCW